MEHTSPRNRSRRGFYLTLTVVLVIVAGLGLYLLAFQNVSVAPTADFEDEATVSPITESVLSGVAEPQNPLRPVEGINPAERANPFSNVRTNPF